MYPKNSLDFIDDVAKELNLPRDLVSDTIHFVYSDLRKRLDIFDDITFTVSRLGTFSTNRAKLQKAKKRLLIKMNSFKESKRYERDLANINNAIVKNDILSIEYYENKLKKLEWHKKNGDPYKKYSEKQEEDCRGIIKYLEKEIKYGGDIK
jgi:hypothetical protein